MNDCTSQDNTRRWIVIIFSVIIGFSGLVFGLISNASERELVVVSEGVNENAVEIRINRNDIQRLKQEYRVIENELGHIKEGVSRVDKKLDKILENGEQ